MILNRAEPPQGMRPRPYFMKGRGRSFDIQDKSDVVEIAIYDEIGPFGISSDEFLAALKQANGRPVKLLINSPGGDVFDGIAMYNDAKAYPGDVIVSVTGLAASAASILAMAGDTIEIAESAFMMIHNAWALSIGDKRAMRKLAETLEQIDDDLADVYAARTGKPASEMSAMMDAETWLKGNAAVEAGLANAITGVSAAKAAYDLSVFAHLPKELTGSFPDVPETRRDLERMLMQDAGMTRSQARAAMRLCQTATQDAGDNDSADLRRLIQSIRSASHGR